MALAFNVGILIAADATVSGSTAAIRVNFAGKLIAFLVALFFSHLGLGVLHRLLAILIWLAMPSQDLRSLVSHLIGSFSNIALIFLRK